MKIKNIVILSIILSVKFLPLNVYGGQYNCKIDAGDDQANDLVIKSFFLESVKTKSNNPGFNFDLGESNVATYEKSKRSLTMAFEYKLIDASIYSDQSIFPLKIKTVLELGNKEKTVFLEMEENKWVKYKCARIILN